MNLTPPPNANKDELLKWASDLLIQGLKSGTPYTLDDIFKECPTLCEDPKNAAHLAVAEYKAQLDSGKNPDPEDWFSRFPQWRSELEQEFAHLALVAADQLTVLEPQNKTDGTQKTDLHLAPHKLFEQIGYGGMGVVYRAEDLLLGRLVALKMIRPELEDEAHIERFNREARAASRPCHPNILPIHAIGLHEGHLCFTMPLIGGGTLELHKKRYFDDVRSAVELMEKVSRAVYAAHLAGVIHRDLKPGNILLDGHGTPFVADFGLAKILDCDQDATRTGLRLGTPAYMAPEQLNSGGSRVGPAADIWALGVIFYEILTGSRAFKGRDQALALAICTKDPIPPRNMRPELSADLETIVLRCLQREATDRYPTANELANDLRRWLEGQAIQAPPEPLLGRAKRARKWPTMTSTAAMLALFLVIVCIGISVQKGIGNAEVPPPDSDVADFIKASRSKSQALNNLKEAQKKGQPLTLMDSRGREQWYRWVTPKNAEPLIEPIENYRQIRAIEEITLLELLPNTIYQNYVLSADVRVENPLQFCSAGIYVMAEEMPTLKGQIIRFQSFYLTSNLKANGNFARYGIFDSLRDEKGRYPNRSKNYPFQAAIEDVGEWHNLAIDVSPMGVTLWVDHIKEKTFSRNALIEKVNGEKALGNAELKAMPLNFQGGMGLYVYHCSAQFRNVNLVPLK